MEIRDLGWHHRPHHDHQCGVRLLSVVGSHRLVAGPSDRLGGTPLPHRSSSCESPEYMPFR
eukprot:1488903-Prymnesium_polylepis.2